MQIAGIIAEYNPFHNGHAWQIRQARRMGAQTVIAVMSSGLVQRGGLPLLPEDVRARAALLAGADIVLELPAPCAGSGAEQFAAAGVAVLAAAGCDTLVCGTENGDADTVLAAARIFCSEAYTAALKTALAGDARSFATAREQAFAAALAADTQGICRSDTEQKALSAALQSPNNNLAVEYAKAILRQKRSMQLCALPRVGAAHDATESGEHESEQVASASRLRELWGEGGASALTPYVPENVTALYDGAEDSGADIDPRALDVAVLSRLRDAAGTRIHGASAFSQVRGVAEGLEYALENAVRHAVTVDGLCDALTTVRYPRARMRRLVFDAALHITPEMNALPPYLHILGARRDALSLLKECVLPASVSLAFLKKQTDECEEFAVMQAKAADLAALCRRTPQGMGGAFSSPCVLL